MGHTYHPNLWRKQKKNNIIQVGKARWEGNTETYKIKSVKCVKHVRTTVLDEAIIHNELNSPRTM
jgi:hypothetical protein